MTGLSHDLALASGSSRPRCVFADRALNGSCPVWWCSLAGGHRWSSD